MVDFPRARQKFVIMHEITFQNFGILMIEISFSPCYDEINISKRARFAVSLSLYGPMPVT